MKAIKIEPYREPKICNVESLSEIKQIIGAQPAIAFLDSENKEKAPIIIYNANGKAENLQLNPLATSYVYSKEGEAIFGTALIMRWSGKNPATITDADIEKYVF